MVVYFSRCGKLYSFIFNNRRAYAYRNDDSYETYRG